MHLQVEVMQQKKEEENKYENMRVKVKEETEHVFWMKREEDDISSFEYGENMTLNQADVDISKDPPLWLMSRL